MNLALCPGCLSACSLHMTVTCITQTQPLNSVTLHPDAALAGLFAIEILAQCPGGAWRTLSEWRAIFEAAGMQLDSAESVGCNMNLMIWKAAGGQ